MCTFDLTSSIDYVLNNTKQESLYFVGHSQGTVLMFAKLAGDPEYAKKIRQFHALAPVATVSHIGGLFKIFGYRLIDIAKFLLARLPNTPLMFPKFIQKIMSYFCSYFSFIDFIDYVTVGDYGIPACQLLKEFVR
ncbi:hypothetical protein TELCIR_15585 [Teladorsagia circumcincta]|uniref:AB hydrolase-1 domain-containing protein n=1 Tax=Teladorsagia circumcincta TaxID=45464 RepID=A0A2G9TXR6_TELCI|nr:hypothetical protein TELCIR_15585 [Teladorsagia circumcincta]